LANFTNVFWLSPKFHNWFTGGVFRIVRTLSHSADSSNGGIDDILVREVARSDKSSSLDDDAWAVVGKEVMSSVADEEDVIILERNDLREEDGVDDSEDE